MASCLRHGDLLVVQGRNLESSERRYERKLYLLSGTKALPLVFQQRSATQIIARIPLSTQFNEGSAYRVAVKNGPAPLDLLALGPALQPCAGGGAAVQPPASAGAGEVLASFRRQGNSALGPLFNGSVPSLIADLEGRGFVLLERRSLPGLGMELLRLDPEEVADLPALLAQLRQEYPSVAFDFNSALDASQGRRYGGQMIGLPDEVCRLPEGSLRIGILDGAADWRHPALADVTQRKEFPAEPPPPSNHGSAIAALIAGNPASGFPGLLPGQELLAAAVLEETASGLSGSLVRLIDGLDWLAGEKADLVLMALEGPANSVLDVALTAAADSGMILIAAVGNGGPRAPVAHPAANRWVFAVTATDVAGELYAKAAQGPEVSFAAPGVDIWSAKAGSGGGYVSGTSFALPFAAAVFAAVLEGFPRSERQGVGALKTRQDLSNVLAARSFDLGQSGRDKQFGWGLLQAEGCR